MFKGWLDTIANRLLDKNIQSLHISICVQLATYFPTIRQPISHVCWCRYGNSSKEYIKISCLIFPPNKLFIHQSLKSVPQNLKWVFLFCRCPTSTTSNPLFLSTFLLIHRSSLTHLNQSSCLLNSSFHQ